MGLSAIRNWLGRGPEAPPPAMQAEPAKPALRNGDAEHDGSVWTEARLGVNDALWGPGYQFPGGEIELMRLVKPLALPTASDLLLLGGGGGGAAASLAARLGVTVFGFEPDPALAAAATRFLRAGKMGRRASASVWDPADPALGSQAYHNCIACDQLRDLQPEPLLAAIARSLKPSGQLMLIEPVADAPLPADDPDVAAWARSERRAPDTLPTEVAVTRVLGRLGFDVRGAEDISARHTQQALLGWRTMVRGMEEARPDATHAAEVVAEAEHWMVRLRLFRDNRLRLMRWHAVGRGAA